jgi:hypothetical protein
MTDEQSKKDAMTFLYGFEKGQTYERKQIVAWLNQDWRGDEQWGEWFAERIEAGEHLK